MDFPNRVQALPFVLLNLLDRYFRFLIQDWPFIVFPSTLREKLDEFNPFRPKPANLLLLGRNDFDRWSVISEILDVDERGRILDFLRRRPELEKPYSGVSIIGGIKFNISNFGELRTACRIWKDYCAKRDAVVYIVNARMEQFSEAREDLNNLLTDEDFENVPFLIFCKNVDPSSSEEELCTLLGLTNMTTGKGMVNLAGTSARPLEVFVVEPSNRKQHQDAIKWLSQYIK